MRTRLLLASTIVLGLLATDALAQGPAPAQGGSASPEPAAPRPDGAAFRVRLQETRTQIDELHDSIRRTRDALATIDDRFTHDASGARAEISLVNAMSGAYRLLGVRVSLDDALVYQRADADGALADRATLPIFSAPVAPGDHVLSIVLDYRGNGALLPYLSGYRYEVRSSHAFTVAGGKTASLAITAFERGTVTTPFEQRPAIAWSQTSKPLALPAR